MHAATKVGAFFWGLTIACAAFALGGLMTRSAPVLISGFTGTGWFLMLACMPREWFLRPVKTRKGSVDESQ